MLQIRFNYVPLHVEGAVRVLRTRLPITSSTVNRPTNVGEARSPHEFRLKLRRLRRLLLPLLSGSRTQRKAKVNVLLRAGYPAVANAVGDAIQRDLQQPLRAERKPSQWAVPTITPSPFADDLAVVASWMRAHPVRYAHLIEQVEAEYLRANGITLPER